MDLSVKIAGLKLKNPVITASGTFGSGREYSQLIDLNKLGAITVKGLSLNPWEGNPYPRATETSCGMLNSIGLQNKGVKDFIDNELPFLESFNTCVIANIVGKTVQEYIDVAKELSKTKKIDALELNISCPNIKEGGISFGSDSDSAARLTSAVKEKTDLPLIVKLTPNCADIAALAKSVELAGADAISLVNTFLGMAIDIDTAKPKLANIVGGLSGPAIKPIALRMVWQVCKEVDIDVIGMGGIANANDAAEFLMVGAKAVAVGTANFSDPQTTIDIIKGLKIILKSKEMTDIKELIGSFNAR
ncbi:MAG: dihydroorotate dehydrogenase [Actinobacteria bacterium]|nr:MAG: dihydroorotate dehydrogenase [Actinomycetota bacterium]